MTEPYTDLPALGIVAVGFILFAYLLLSAYSSYATSAYYGAVRGDLAHIAHAAAADPALTCTPYTFEARKLDNATALRADYGYRAVRMTVEAPDLRWSWGRSAGGRAASCSLPVSVRLSDARCVSGTLRVTMWEE